jgi:mono/diheme cytochrome c family protein
MVGIFGILNGGHGAATKGAPTAASMPAFDWQLSDQQVADVASYIRSAWGNAAASVQRDTAKSSN